MTTRLCATVSVDPSATVSDRVRVCEALGRLVGAVPEIVHSHAALHLEGSVGAGELTWDFAIAEARALDALQDRLAAHGWAGMFANAEPEDRADLGRIVHIEAWRIDPIASHVPRADLIGIKRTNLVRVRESAGGDDVERWGREVVQLADHVPAIRNWSLARTVAFGPSTPRVRWTHAWEQEFETLGGLVEDYMASPYHWGWLDGWYDPEVPFCIVEPDLAHLYCAATQNVLAWSEPFAYPEEAK